MKWIHLVFFVLISISAIGQITFEKSYGGPDYEDSHCVRQTFEGGYIIAGSTSLGSGAGDIYVIKTDASGDTIWTRTYGAVNLDFGNNIIQTADSGFVIAGSYYSLGGGCLIKIDGNGNLIWNKLYHGAEITSLVENSNHEIAFTGITGHPGGSNSDIWFLKTDSMGNVMTTFTYDDSDDERGSSLYLTSDQGYLIYGEKGSIAPYQRIAIRIDSSGNVLWSKKFEDNMLNFFVARNVCHTNDNGTILFCSATGSGAVDLVKVDSLGNIVWIRHYLPVNNNKVIFPFTVQNTPDGGFIVTGYCTDNNLQARNTFLIKTDSTGNVDWSYIYGDTTRFDNEGHYVVCTSDNGYSVAGSRFVNGAVTDISLIKVDQNGHNLCYVDLPLNVSSANIIDSLFLPDITPGNYPSSSFVVSIGSGGNVFSQCPITNLINENSRKIFSFFPNPFHSSATLKMGNEELKIRNCELKIYNSMGALMRTEKISNLESYILYRGSLNDGMYFYELRTNNYEILGTGKFIVE